MTTRQHPAVVENPVITSPHGEPRRQFVFDNEGITNQIAEGQQANTFTPITPPKQEEAQFQGPKAR